MRTRMRCPIIQVPLPDVRDKTTEINGLTLQQPFFEHVGLCETFIADKMWHNQQSSHCELSCMSAYKKFLEVELLL